ncbi:dihydrodipicolinate synthase family protein [Bradyrhizobium sp. CB82]|uniref:dihydrodipicolinate synthase family protein n=1 Tax=Bradyrhizobium sp. CB82 TaxID=3039159 RepID=UPI0024B17D9D|nr:dihydrodipicolinate synthase family protein [Bradyrhizobium sp. CB82]WFU41523.1 dihydrodipicolinate synthase family protein [Bradyrhizobium sp. CB82]
MADLADHLFVALVLPLTHDFRIDEPGLRRLVRHYAENKKFAAVGGLVANPEAGEIFYLSQDEKRRALDIVMEEASGKMPILAGTFGWTTHDVVQTAKDAKAAGVDGIFCIPPAGAMDITTSWDAEKYPEVWLDQIKEQDRAVDLPIFTHPVAASTAAYGIGLPKEPTLQICREVPNVVGWKMTYSYGGHRLISRALRSQAPRVAIMGAAAHYFHENLATGDFRGTISGSWNYALNPMLSHIEAWRRKDIDAANQIWNGGLVQLHEYIYSEWGRLHIRYKIAAWLCGLVDSPLMRPPMPKPRKIEVDTIAKLLKEAGIETISKPDPEMAA